MKWYKFNIKNLSDSDYEYYYSLMSEDKKIRVDKFRFIDDKKRTVAGEMLCRKAIAEFYKVKPESIVIETDKNGKPYAKGMSVEFNLSHSGDFVVCVVSDKKVGIDIERIRPINLNVAKRVCSEEELRFIFKRTPIDSDFSYTEDEEVLVSFFELWTKKEAYIKCSGKGLSGGLRYTPNIKSIVENGYVISIYKE